MKIYIAGKISGNETYREEFKRVEDMFKGNVVLNPSVLPKGLTKEEYAKIDFAMINSSDMVCFLPNFRESEGAMLEYRYCKYIGKKMMEINNLWWKY